MSRSQDKSIMVHMGDTMSNSRTYCKDHLKNLNLNNSKDCKSMFRLLDKAIMVHACQIQGLRDYSFKDYISMARPLDKGIIIHSSNVYAKFKD